MTLIAGNSPFDAKCYNFCLSTVGKHPQIQVPPPGEVIVIERSLKLIPCKPIGSPTPVTYWYAGDDPNPLTDNAKYTIYQNGSLLIRNIKQPDALKYTCKAKNLVGEAKAETTVKIACKCRNSENIPSIHFMSCFLKSFM